MTGCWTSRERTSSERGRPVPREGESRSFVQDARRCAHLTPGEALDTPTGRLTSRPDPSSATRTAKHKHCWL